MDSVSSSVPDPAINVPLIGALRPIGNVFLPGDAQKLAGMGRRTQGSIEKRAGANILPRDRICRKPPSAQQAAVISAHRDATIGAISAPNASSCDEQCARMAQVTSTSATRRLRSHRADAKRRTKPAAQTGLFAPWAGGQFHRLPEKAACRSQNVPAVLGQAADGGDPFDQWPPSALPNLKTY